MLYQSWSIVVGVSELKLQWRSLVGVLELELELKVRAKNFVKI